MSGVILKVQGKICCAQVVGKPKSNRGERSHGRDRMLAQEKVFPVYMWSCSLKKKIKVALALVLIIILTVIKSCIKTDHNWANNHNTLKQVQMISKYSKNNQKKPPRNNNQLCR